MFLTESIMRSPVHSYCIIFCIVNNNTICLCQITVQGSGMFHFNPFAGSKSVHRFVNWIKKQNRCLPDGYLESQISDQRPIEETLKYRKTLILDIYIYMTFG